MTRFGDVERCWVSLVADASTLERQLDLVDFALIRELDGDVKGEGLGKKELEERFYQVTLPIEPMSRKCHFNLA